MNSTAALAQAKDGDQSALLRLLESQRPHLRVAARGRLDTRCKLVWTRAIWRS